MACSKSCCQLAWALKPTASSRSLRCSITSRQLVPMEPVDPSTTTRRRNSDGWFAAGETGTHHPENEVEDWLRTTGRLAGDRRQRASVRVAGRISYCSDKVG